jgi:hypothetical protein
VAEGVRELRELGGQMQNLLRPYTGRLDDPTRRPAGSRPVTVLHLAFPALIAGPGSPADPGP